MSRILGYIPCTPLVLAPLLMAPLSLSKYLGLDNKLHVTLTLDKGSTPKSFFQPWTSAILLEFLHPQRLQEIVLVYIPLKSPNQIKNDNKQKVKLRDRQDLLNCDT